MFIVGGNTDSFGVKNSFGAFTGDVWLLKLDSDGNIQNCINDVTIQDTDSAIEDIEDEANDVEVAFDDPGTFGGIADAVLEDSSAEVNTQCSSISPPANYSLELFENMNEPSDGVAGLNQELRAVASTDDSSVDQVTFRWISPSAEIAQEVTVPISSPEDTFAPDEPGDWIMEADFGNGQVIQKTLSISFFVIPESPIGAIAMVAASMASLGAFLYFRMARKQGIDI